jgi:nucleoid-associated protein YgaU
MSRYRNRPNAINRDQLYEEMFEERGVTKINQFVTPELSNPSQEVLDSLPYRKYVWTVGDRYWRLAQLQYGDRNLWYIIARFNNKPTEGHIQPGDLIKIPTDVRRTLEVLG